MMRAADVADVFTHMRHVSHKSPASHEWKERVGVWSESNHTEQTGNAHESFKKSFLQVESCDAQVIRGLRADPVGIL